MKELSPDLNLDQESAAIVEFLRQKWTTLPNLPELVASIREEALHAGRGWTERFDIGFLAGELHDARVALLDSPEAPAPEARYYDAYCHFLNRIGYLDDALHAVGLRLDGEWDFARREKKLAWRLTEQFPGLTAMAPLGMEHSADVNEDDLCEAYSAKADRDLFQGSKAEGVMSGTFPWRVALSTVLSVKRNGLDAWHQLVGAVFGHFLVIAQYLNTHRAMEALKKALPYDSPEIQFTLPERFENPFLQALLTWAGPPQTKSAFEGSTLMREAMKLPEAERAAFVNAKPELVRAYGEGINLMRNRMDHHDRQAREEMTALLRELLQGSTADRVTAE